MNQCNTPFFYAMNAGCCPAGIVTSLSNLNKFAPNLPLRDVYMFSTALLASENQVYSSSSSQRSYPPTKRYRPLLQLHLTHLPPYMGRFVEPTISLVLTCL